MYRMKPTLLAKILLLIESVIFASGWPSCLSVVVGGGVGGEMRVVGSTINVDGVRIEAEAKSSGVGGDVDDGEHGVDEGDDVGDADDKEFERRLRISEQLLKEREVAVKEGKVNPQGSLQ